MESPNRADTRNIITLSAYTLDRIYLSGYNRVNSDIRIFVDKAARIQLFYSRLLDAPAVGSHYEGYQLLCTTLTAVEDEHSGTPNDSNNWQTDGRMYPPQNDRCFKVDGFPEVFRYRSFGHNTYIASNGAIEIRRIRSNEILFMKHGKDGKGVWE